MALYIFLNLFRNSVQSRFEERIPGFYERSFHLNVCFIISRILNKMLEFGLISFSCKIVVDVHDDACDDVDDVDKMRIIDFH